MTEKQQYWLGVVLCYIVGMCLVPIYFVVIAICRIGMAVCSIAYDTFMFTPRVVNAFIYNQLDKQKTSVKDWLNLN